jgi:hypothetical protein
VRVEQASGSRIIRALTAQIKARLKIDSTPGVGTTVTMHLALSEVDRRRFG